MGKSRLPWRQLSQMTSLYKHAQNCPGDMGTWCKFRMVRLAILLSTTLPSLDGARAATCAFTNAHPNVTDAYLALAGSSTGVFAVSGWVAYGSTAFFECHQKIRGYTAFGPGSGYTVFGPGSYVIRGLELVREPWPATFLDLSCQARSIFPLEPLTATQPFGDYPIDLPTHNRADMGCNKYQIWHINSAFNGSL